MAIGKKRLTGPQIFIKQITKGSGVHSMLLKIQNQNEGLVEQDDEKKILPKASVATIKSIDAPEWIVVPKFEELAKEGITDSDDPEITFKPFDVEFTPDEEKRYKLEINSNHQFFPETSFKGTIKLIYDIEGEEEELTFRINISRIDEIPVFQGVFALDFGTSNSCYAYREPFAEAEDDMVKISHEIPTAIFYDRVQNVNPEYSFGEDALRKMKEHPEAIFSYFLSIKRLLGVNKEEPFMVVDLNPQCEGEEFNEIQIAAHIVKGIIDKHQKDNQIRIPNFHATYPTLFSRPRKEAMLKTLKEGLRLANPETTDDAVKLTIDEASAAAFGFISEKIQHSIQQIRNVEDDSRTILAFDFGGGTIDIAMIDIDVKMTSDFKVDIKQVVRGLSGDSYYGGDNVTLAVFRILKFRLAEKISKFLLESADKNQEDEFASATKKEAASDFSNFFAAEEEEVDEELSEEEKARRDKLVEAARFIQADENPEILEHMLSENLHNFEEGFKSYFTANDKSIDGSKVSNLAKKLEESVDVMVPTRYTIFEKNNDPEMKEIAQQIFYELWFEAEMRKREAVEKEQEVTVKDPLNILSKYTTAEPEIFREVKLSYGDIKLAINKDCHDSVLRAKGLYDNVIAELKDKFPTYKPRPLDVVLAGNSSRIPMVKELLSESFQDAASVIFAKNRKGVTAQGACEIASLPPIYRLESRDFSSKLPYSIGMWSKSLYIQFDHGFEMIFPRGTIPGEEGMPSRQIYYYKYIQTNQDGSETGSEGDLAAADLDEFAQAMFKDNFKFSVEEIKHNLEMAKKGTLGEEFMEDITAFVKKKEDELKQAKKDKRELDDDYFEKRIIDIRLLRDVLRNELLKKTPTVHFADNSSMIFLGENYAMIQEGKVPRIKIYSYYHDEVEPQPIGLFNLRNTAGDIDEEEHTHCMEAIEKWKTVFPDWRERFATDKKSKNPFGYVLELKDDWTIRLIDPRKNLYFELDLTDDIIPPERMPFNGMH